LWKLATVAQGVKFITHDGASVIFREAFPALRYFGKIVVENNCFIGEGSIVMAGVRIGTNSIIGPMSVVFKDVKPGSMVIGNPAIQVSRTEKYRERCLQEWENQGLGKFDLLFEGKNKYQVQNIMLSEKFRKELKEHLLSIEFRENNSKR
jgi:tetrahydrodipicolinate N-succinyltransferase